MENLLETQQLVVPTSSSFLETPTGVCPFILLHCFCCFLASTAWNKDVFG